LFYFIRFFYSFCVIFFIGVLFHVISFLDSTIAWKLTVLPVQTVNCGRRACTVWDPNTDREIFFTDHPDCVVLNIILPKDELMHVLILVRHFLPGYHQVINGDQNVAGIACRSYDLEGKDCWYMSKIGSVWNKFDYISCWSSFFFSQKGGTTVSIYPSRSINLFVEML
jgi:hypothetical protein